MNHDWIYPLIGAVIKRRRKQFDWTQEKLAARLGISRASLANIEIGRQANSGAGELPLPPGLKQQQKEQITRLFDRPQPASSQGKEGSNGKQAKR